MMKVNLLSPIKISETIKQETEVNEIDIVTAIINFENKRITINYNDGQKFRFSNEMFDELIKNTNFIENAVKVYHNSIDAV